jgi:hypothetical protein
VRRPRIDTEAVAAAFPGWLAARFLVLAGLVVATVAVNTLSPDAHPVHLTNRLLAWDGGWYQGIAQHGYKGVAPEAIRFFPLFPLLSRAVSVLLLGHTGAAMLVVSNSFALLAGALLYRLAREEGASVAASRRGAWFFAVFPSAFVLVWGYAEALMLAASIGCFLALRRGRWGWAALLGAAAALSRPLGLLLVVPALIEAARGFRTADVRSRIARLAAVAGPALGTGAFLLWSKIVFHDFWLPFSSQKDFRGSADPISRLAEGVRELRGAQSLGDGLHLPFALGLIVLVYLALRRLPLSYGAYSLVVVVAALSAQNLNSLERYGFNAFPIVIALALSTDDDIIERLALVSCAGGILAFSALAWVGGYVP